MEASQEGHYFVVSYLIEQGEGECEGRRVCGGGEGECGGRRGCGGGEGECGNIGECVEILGSV